MLRLFRPSLLYSCVSCMSLKIQTSSSLSFTYSIEVSNFLGSLCFQWRKIGTSNVPTHYLYSTLRCDGIKQDSAVCFGYVSKRFCKPGHYFLHVSSLSLKWK